MLTDAEIKNNTDIKNEVNEPTSEQPHPEHDGQNGDFATPFSSVWVKTETEDASPPEGPASAEMNDVSSQFVSK